MNTLKNKTNELKAELQRFSGSETFFQMPLTKTRFTDGIQYLATAAQCYWLITDASVMAKSLVPKSYFITIDFKRLSEKEQKIQGCEAVITYGDGNDHILEKQQYQVTDFPLDELRLFFVDNTLMLPGEY